MIIVQCWNIRVRRFLFLEKLKIKKQQSSDFRIMTISPGDIFRSHIFYNEGPTKKVGPFTFEAASHCRPRD